MAKHLPVDPNRPATKTDAPVACQPPEGQALVPVGTSNGDTLVWNATTGRWEVVSYPNPATGQVWTAGANGPFWANP